jgi:hypothetical protein
VLVIAVVAIAVFAQAGGGSLLGTAALTLTPSNPHIYISQTIPMSVNSIYPCVWTSDNLKRVSFVVDKSEVKQVTLQAQAKPGALITAKCGIGAFNVNLVSTPVEALSRSINTSISTQFETPTGYANDDELGVQ